MIAHLAQKLKFMSQKFSRKENFNSKVLREVFELLLNVVGNKETPIKYIYPLLAA